MAATKLTLSKRGERVVGGGVGFDRRRRGATRPGLRSGMELTLSALMNFQKREGTVAFIL